MPRAKHNYEVIVQNLGRVYEGQHKAAASSIFRSYCRDVKQPHGRVSGEIVDFYTDGEITESFDPAAPNVKLKPKKVKYVLPDELWVMGYHTHNVLGSITHVSSGEKFFTSKAACQEFIDKMPGWIGMGDRSRYRPLQLINGE